ncbi:hypothetical protein Q4Q34_02265 [Flavivirga abyssicola]|uniref:hypothetical protein n=1 Tax=Flavivirga abyssicola TaxID=3063533 RepID=UPI0026DFA9D4|nr:hypothetical protein [Flavivirga sp. MEBiC07777]WVK13862.1 hypothetical protein Q4Q34_02265 [Flavivirga sp. MEBiC07777]
MKKIKFSLSNAEVLNRDQQRKISGGYGEECFHDIDCFVGSCVNDTCMPDGGDAFCRCLGWNDPGVYHPNCSWCSLRCNGNYICTGI